MMQVIEEVTTKENMYEAAEQLRAKGYRLMRVVYTATQATLFAVRRVIG